MLSISGCTHFARVCRRTTGAEQSSSGNCVPLRASLLLAGQSAPRRSYERIVANPEVMPILDYFRVGGHSPGMKVEIQERSSAPVLESSKNGSFAPSAGS